MSERRFVLVDFTHMSGVGCLRLYEAGRAYVLPRAVAHAATKRELVAKQRPAGWMPPSMFRLPEVLTELCRNLGDEVIRRRVWTTLQCPRCRLGIGPLRYPSATDFDLAAAARSSRRR